ncbi:CRISPR-associated helicase Cas3' [Pseudescherichia sp.]|uniref:CRISPR-associated helicase Cas3' n=1 Tax=Pseudescherichia sp. TaxID=2055881 RepID=UPI0028ACDEBA|nr:CRISPR-associated helicase Cas3' [Pseudescherichia sp.]
MNFDASYLHYWGKSKKTITTGDNYHLLVYHCLDVAACGYIMASENRFGMRDVLAELGLASGFGYRWIGYLFACHDLGKFANGFQRLAAHPGAPLVLPAAGVNTPGRHDTLGFWLWDKLETDWLDDKPGIFPEISSDQRDEFIYALDIWMAVSTGHHGFPPEKPNDCCVTAFTKHDIHAANEYLTALGKIFSINLLPAEWKVSQWRKKLQQQSWFLAGVMTLADWLGSDENHFSFTSQPMPLEEYWTIACDKARKALSTLPLSSNIHRYEGHQALFPFIQTLTPLQQRAADLDISSAGPQLIVLEDVTGAGKTEAAMILAHRLMSAGKGKGVYVGLPTMATSNAMYQRLGKAYRKLFSDTARPSLVLAHGARHMSTAFRQSVWQTDKSQNMHYAQNDASAVAECNAWFADSRKTALLAEVGVGTLDQVLMAIMPFRHQSLRLVGLRDKVLILDEVHAYDAYMVKLLEGLLWFHAAQGGSAIVLTATLPATLKEKLLTAFAAGAGFAAANPALDAGYPWLSHLSSTGLHEYPLQTRQEVKRCVAINWLSDIDRALEIIYRVVEAGQCICWVRNTVDDALMVFLRLLNDGKIAQQDLLLFHSRFAYADRMTIEENTLAWFGKDAAPETRRGKVLIATQVVEQSLDLDFDWMISDLAPVDLLIQRAGRLQRHIRNAHGVCKSSLPDERRPPILHILAPEWQEEAEAGWLGKALRGTGYVYTDHACLWRTQKLLRQYGEIRMPEMARTLIDGVYEGQIPAPPGLKGIEDDVYGALLSQRAAARQNLLQRDKGYHRDASDFLWDEGREFSTRLGETSVDVYLAWLDDDGQLQPVVKEGEFRWEMSRVQVRASLWKQNVSRFSLPDEALLEAFRKRHHRPVAQVLLVSEQGEAAYYSKRFGLSAAS